MSWFKRETGAGEKKPQPDEGARRVKTEGLPPAWRERADLLVSLSRLTLPHELARAVLAEQIYRAFTTLRGHPYPR